MAFSSKETVAIALLAIAANAHSATAESSNAGAIEELVVKGRALYSDQVNALKTPTPILNVPQSLSLFTAEQVRDRGFNSIGELIAYMPGVHMSQGEGHRDAVVFRGVRSTADFFIDGVRDDVQYYRPLYNIEQIEVLRGPNALLFGRGGTGGVLNRVTKKAALNTAFTEAQVAGDSFGELSGQIDHNMSLGEFTALRVNAFAERLDNHRDFYDGDRIGVNPTLRFKRNQTQFDLSYEYVDHDRFIDRGIPTGANGRPVEALEKVTFGDPGVNKTTLEAHLARASVQHKFSDTLKLNASLYHGTFDKYYANFYASGYNEEDSPDQVTLDGYVDTTDRENTIFSGNVVKGLDLSGTAHTILAGVELIDTSSDQDRFNAFWDTTEDDNEVFPISRDLGLRSGRGTNALGVATSNDFSADINDDTRVDVEVTSIFLQDEIELTDRFRVVAGIRYDSFEIDVLNAVSDEQRRKEDSEISPRFGLIFKPAENVSVYASYSESFLPRSGEQYANINGSKEQLSPNTFQNQELGLKYDFPGGLSLTAAFFEIEQRSPQVADNNPETLDVIESEIEGFELQLMGRINDYWTVSAAYSSLEGEQVSRQGSTGLTPRELPDSTFSLWNEFAVRGDLTLGLGVTHQSESFINNSNTAFLPSYTRYDASLRYRISERISAQLNVENLTDELYFPSSHSTHQATVGVPLNARLAINISL